MFKNKKEFDLMNWEKELEDHLRGTWRITQVTLIAVTLVLAATLFSGCTGEPKVNLEKHCSLKVPDPTEGYIEYNIKVFADGKGVSDCGFYDAKSPNTKQPGSPMNSVPHDPRDNGLSCTVSGWKTTGAVINGELVSCSTLRDGTNGPKQDLSCN